MTRRTFDHHEFLLKELKDPKIRKGYLNAALDGRDKKHFLSSLKNVTDALDEGKIVKSKPKKPNKANLPKKTRLRSKSNKFLFEYNGTKFYKPGPKLAKEIDEKADAIMEGRVKGIRWKGSFDKTFAKQPKP